MVNNKVNNQTLPQIIENYVRWDEDRDILTESTAQDQWVKGLEEYLEVYAALHPEKSADGIRYSVVDIIHGLGTKGRIKGIEENQDPQVMLVDGIGDTLKCLTSVAEISGVGLADAAQHTYTEIKDRKGKMIDGTFVKEEDIHD